MFVFEDSPTGVVGTQSAVDLLARNHLAIRVGFLGISSGSEKRAALLSLGAEVFDSTDDALEMVWGKAGS
jgi:hypothetical protein